MPEESDFSQLDHSPEETRRREAMAELTKALDINSAILQARMTNTTGWTAYCADFLDVHSRYRLIVSGALSISVKEIERLIERLRIDRAFLEADATEDAAAQQGHTDV